MNYLSEFLRNSGSQYPIQDGGEFRPDLAEEFAKMKAAGWFDEGNGTDPSEQGNLQNALLGYPDQNSRAMQRQPRPDNPGQPPANLGGTVSTLNGWGAQAQKEKAALDAMFQGALAGGDIEKAARLAVTPQQQALLSVAYGQRANDQDRRARQESGLPVGAPTDLMKNYNDAQYTNVMRSQAEQDRQAKMAMMGAQFTNLNERTAASQQARNTKEMPKPKASTEDEKKAAGWAIRMENSLRAMDEIGAKYPDAVKPSIGPKAAGKLPLVGDDLENSLNTSPRRQIEATQLDALDAALTLATGAAYTREQLKNLSKSYFPQIGDEPEDVAFKKDLLNKVVETARIRAGTAAGAVDEVLGPRPEKANGPAAASKTRFDAQKAIAAGAPREAVNARLVKMGLEPI